jgi:hypothetical protein
MSWWHYHQNAKAQSQSVAQPERSADSQRAAQPVLVDSPAVDPAEKILRGDPNMSDEGRATAYDMFHGSKDHLELARKIQHVEMSNDTRHRLWEAKKLTAPVVDPVAKARAAIEMVSKMEPNDLEVAEKNPTVLKLIASAVLPSKSKE